jgi:phosphoglycolate phosphatase
MTKSFDLIVFDWDGTLMDSTAHIVYAIQHAAADLGLPIPSAESARQVIGLSLQAALETACPDLPLQRHQEMASACRKHYVAGDGAAVLFDGVADGLRELTARGVTLAVATGKSRRGLNQALEATGLRAHFAATRTQDDCPSKPHPAMLLELMEQLGVTAQRTLMVGDTTFDLSMAQQAGSHAVGMCYGAHEREALQRHAPLDLFEDFHGLRRWLAQRLD